jgi:hypothetical protein
MPQSAIKINMGGENMGNLVCKVGPSFFVNNDGCTTMPNDYVGVFMDTDTYDRKDEIKAAGFKWDGSRWIKNIKISQENLEELANAIKSAKDIGAEVDYLIRGFSDEKINAELEKQGKMPVL